MREVRRRDRKEGSQIGKGRKEAMEAKDRGRDGEGERKRLRGREEEKGGR